MSDWKGLGEAISEAIALKQAAEAIQQKMNNCDGEIESNTKEIEKRKNLEATNKDLKAKKAAMVTEKTAVEKELQERMDKLEAAGVSLPDSVPSGGKVSF